MLGYTRLATDCSENGDTYMNAGVVNAETEMSDSANEVCPMELKPTYGEYTDGVFLSSCCNHFGWDASHPSLGKVSTHLTLAFSAGCVNVLNAKILSILLCLA